MAPPAEIIRAPFTVWIADVGEAFPDLDTSPPGGNWLMLGTSGPRNYNDEGVTVSHPQTIEKFRGAGATGAQKAWRTEEDLMVAFMLADLTLEQYRYALNGNAVTDVAPGAGTVGYRHVDLYRGPGEVKQHALLIRGDVSPYGDFSEPGQYEVPVCIEEGAPEIQYGKTGHAFLALVFAALEDPNAASAAARFGRLLFPDADPT